jgi:hypothetical protein
MTMSGRDTRAFIRIDPTKTGSTDQVPTDIELQSWDLPLQVQIGISIPAVHSEDYGWIVAVEAVHSSDNDESVNIGTQLGYRNAVFLRGGFQGLFLPGYYNGLAIDHGEGGLSFGFGVVATQVADNINLKFDYAFRDMGRLENIHTFSLGMEF